MPIDLPQRNELAYQILVDLVRKQRVELWSCDTIAVKNQARRLGVSSHVLGLLLLDIEREAKTNLTSALALTRRNLEHQATVRAHMT
jgi:hypothetical protein